MFRGELTELNLESCLIGNEGAEIVADFLEHDETVRSVSLGFLGYCSIGLRGTKAIAEALKHNKTVNSLGLDNRIGDEGVTALVDALAHNVCIFVILFLNTSSDLETIRYLTLIRNIVLIPAAVRRASLFLIAAGRTIAGAGILAIFPKEIVKMIAMEVFATRNDPIWIEALSETERTGPPENWPIRFKCY